MSVLIVADTGPLVILAKLDQLNLLKYLYTDVHLPLTVFNEATVLAQRTDARRVTDFVSQSATLAPAIEANAKDFIDFGLDAGETQAILLAKRLGCTLLIDERKGRLVAQQEHLAVLGTLGLLLKAKQAQLIPTLTPLLEQMLENDYRLAPALVEKAKELAGE